MLNSVRARFMDGALTPLEPIELEDGEEVELEVKTAQSPERVIHALRATAGAWKGTHDPEELKKMLYEARFTGSRETPSP